MFSWYVLVCWILDLSYIKFRTLWSQYCCDCYWYNFPVLALVNIKSISVMYSIFIHANNFVWLISHFIRHWFQRNGFKPTRQGVLGCSCVAILRVHNTEKKGLSSDFWFTDINSHQAKERLHVLGCSFVAILRAIFWRVNNKISIILKTNYPKNISFQFNKPCVPLLDQRGRVIWLLLCHKSCWYPHKHDPVPPAEAVKPPFRQ